MGVVQPSCSLMGEREPREDPGAGPLWSHRQGAAWPAPSDHQQGTSGLQPSASGTAGFQWQPQRELGDATFVGGTLAGSMAPYARQQSLLSAPYLSTTHPSRQTIAPPHAPLLSSSVPEGSQRPYVDFTTLSQRLMPGAQSMPVPPYATASSPFAYTHASTSQDISAGSPQAGWSGPTQLHASSLPRSLEHGHPWAGVSGSTSTVAMQAPGVQTSTSRSRWSSAGSAATKGSENELDVSSPPSEAGAGGGPRPFILKLLELLSEDECRHAIRWSNDGNALLFCQRDPVLLEGFYRKFKHRNANSFIRQLNAYGFRRLSAAEMLGVLSDLGPRQSAFDWSGFVHPDMRRHTSTAVLETILPRKTDDPEARRARRRARAQAKRQQELQERQQHFQSVQQSQMLPQQQSQQPRRQGPSMHPEPPQYSSIYRFPRLVRFPTHELHTHGLAR